MNHPEEQTDSRNRGKAGWLAGDGPLTRVHTRSQQLVNYWLEGNTFDMSTAQLGKEALLGWATAAVAWGIADLLTGSTVAIILLLLTFFSAIGAFSRSVSLLQRLTLWWDTRGYRT